MQQVEVLLTSFHQIRYGQWLKDPVGVPAIPDRCAQSIWNTNNIHKRQCTRVRRHGAEKAFCAQHAINN